MEDQMNYWITDRPPREGDCHDGAEGLVEVTRDNGMIGWERVAALCDWKQGEEGYSVLAWRPIFQPYKKPDCGEGYEWVKKGDLVHEGDEYLRDDDLQWRPSCRTAGTAKVNSAFHYRRPVKQSEAEAEKFDYTTLPAVLIDGLVQLQRLGHFVTPDDGPQGGGWNTGEHGVVSWAADCLKALKEHE